MPKKDDENKQRDIKNIYEILCNNGEKLEETIIDLESSFRDITYKYALCKYIINSFKKIRNLKGIDNDEEKEIQILDILYKYIPPALEKYQKLNFFPNQFGDLLGYNDLSEEKELSSILNQFPLN